MQEILSHEKTSSPEFLIRVLLKAIVGSLSIDGFPLAAEAVELDFETGAYDSLSELHQWQICSFHSEKRDHSCESFQRSSSWHSAGQLVNRSGCSPLGCNCCPEGMDETAGDSSRQGFTRYCQPHPQPGRASCSHHYRRTRQDS